ncbi:MAG TPA: protein phosphatase 2C domain-containing protein [Chloroflexota bacterium]|nr:protein phosphatase 2C domain-containing protein [Chloroflexota bacterium]
MVLTRSCPRCGIPVTGEVDCCPLDGTPLADNATAVAEAPVATCACGQPRDGGDGICEECGTPIRVPLPPARRVIVGGAELAVVTDIGKRHPVNQDAATALVFSGDDPARIFVVCDGISSCHASDQAAQLAAETARDYLRDALQAGPILVDALAEAVSHAHAAICARDFGPAEPGKDPPGTTIVVGVIRGSRVYLSWVGDSRAYWLGESGGERLTRDHSWAEELIASGVAPEEAYRGPNGHALTHCLGPVEVMEGDRAPEPAGKVFDLPGAGWLLLCSDGLWNYAPAVDDLQGLLAGLPDDALARSERLVAYALERGGRDNITVALTRLSPGG